VKHIVNGANAVWGSPGSLLFSVKLLDVLWG